MTKLRDKVACERTERDVNNCAYKVVNDKVVGDKVVCV